MEVAEIRRAALEAGPVAWYGPWYGDSKDHYHLRDDRIQEIRARVAAGQAPNVSAFVQHAVGVALFDAAGWKEMLEQALQQTGGPLTPKERAWADTLLSSRESKKHRKNGKAA